MSTDKKSHEREERAREDALAHVVREARADLRPPKYGPAFDWDRTERELFARVEEDRKVEAAYARFEGSKAGWGAVMGLMAAAAAVVLVLGAPPARQAHYDGTLGASSAEGTAGALASKIGEGDVRIHGPGGALAAQPGAKLRRTDTVEARGAGALFHADGRATWLLESGSSMNVKSVEPIVLGLETGAVEAEVVPVSQGEAFAVDVDGVRVAVHGTHLRVERTGDRVTVDLAEGVVSIGVPPRVGSTYGTLVMAPAHVTFAISELAGSLRIVHDTHELRAPLALASLAGASEAPSHVALAAPAGQVSAPPRAATAPSHARNPGASQSPAAAGPLEVDPRAEETVAAAVRACSADAPHSTDVTVTVTSTLELRVGDDGFVKSARFDPPLAPEIQTCASVSIYHVRFADVGMHRIPLVLAR
jgi:hypothetical protein